MYRVPKRYHDIREGGVRMSDKDTASGLRAHVHNQEFGRRQRANVFSDLFYFFGLFFSMKIKMHQQQIYII
jgi:hypothetical protein